MSRNNSDDKLQPLTAFLQNTVKAHLDAWSGSLLRF